ncbi:protein STICHEL-like 2 [Quillaja saponaria]|uniref:Protein STICHEL-like 2 n=1 Tax=Quillaja saponaria TaxID=32244 RepID=A0AAD7KUD1_QUISA|nr:protein STICHEL-like 2 [Quillaja saponaria]
MTDGRQHSVDIPISKTLVALRRVKSLRDPSTNSMSKFSALVDHWENCSNNGISLRFLDTCHECSPDNRGVLRSKGLGFNEEIKDFVADFELNSGMGKCSEILGWAGNEGTTIRTEQGDGLDYSGSNQEDVSTNKSMPESYGSNFRDKGLDLACITPSSNHSEYENSSYEPIGGLSQFERPGYLTSKRKLRRKNQVKSSKGMGDIANYVGSPWASDGDAMSTPSLSKYINEDVDAVDHNQQGCGISHCWSKTPRFRESNRYSNVEESRLLRRVVNETASYGWRSLRLIGNEISPSSETPRSLSQKFRPECFDDLVGQNVVARSLLGAISKGRIMSFYLFHGPRGTGKTSASRIFAAALNCLSLEEHRPCGMCQECMLFFSGRSKDVKEMDSVRINRKDEVKSLIKHASTPPVSSRFKVFIVDECQLLHGETWATLLNSVENFSQHVVFVMITPNLEKLPRTAVSRSQSFHFPRIKDVDIASRLGKICRVEGLEFDQVALDFIATKSNGSLRDAEMMIDQLSLLGKKITINLAYELTGIVSDDELLELLDLALSSDTPNTVIRARELMRSRIDPVQLISRIANLIMDILAGKWQDESSEVQRRFLNGHNSEADLQKLNHALRILSETEKQLRMSKNQTTWFTVALLQLGSVEYSSADAYDSKFCLRTSCDGDRDLRSTSSPTESLKHLASCPYDDKKSYKVGGQEECKGTLDSVWNEATELCQPTALKIFLRKRGKLSSLCVNEGLAVAELEFHHRDYVSKAEKSWKLIANSLQLVLGCNIEIRINLVRCNSDSQYVKVRKLSFSLFSCCRRMQQKSFSSNEQGSDTDYCGHTSQKPMMERPQSCSCDCGSRVQHDFYHRMEAARTLRNSDEALLSSGKTLSCGSFQETSKTPGLRVDTPKEERKNYGCEVLSVQEPDRQPNCFPKNLWLHKKLRFANASMTSFMGTQQQKEFVLSIPSYT